MSSQDPTTAPAAEAESAAQRLERHALMAAIATRFLAVPTESIGGAVDEALSAIGRFAGVDRMALALFDARSERWRVDHDWHGEGLWSLRGMVEHVAPFRWTLPRLMSGTALEVLDSRDLPPQAANEGMLLKGLDVGAALLLPVFRDDGVTGFVAAATTAPRTAPWPASVHALLELPARMMMHALARARTEKRLRESQDRWDSLCRTNVVGVLSTRRSDGTIFDANDAALRMLGRTREELERGDVHWANTTHPDERDLDLRMFGILERTGRVMPWEKLLWRPDDTRVPAYVSVAAVGEDSDELVSVAIDLSSRSRVTEELKKRDDIDHLHADLSRRLVDLVGDDVETAVHEALGRVAVQFGFEAVAVYDVDAELAAAGRRLWWQAATSRLPKPERRLPLAALSWWRERLKAGRTTFLAGAASLPESARAEREAISRAGLQAMCSVPLLPGGTPRGLLLFYSAEPVEVPDDLLAALRVFGDILANALERLRIDREVAEAVATLERRIEQRVSQLEASNAELEAFAYSVSHDLRAPLRTIDGLCQVLREDHAGVLAEEALLLLTRIQAATRRMGRLIDGLLQLSRVVRTPMEWNEVSLSDLAEGVAEEWRARVAPRSVDVRVQPGLVLRGHARLLRVAFEQLMDNAFKFTGPRADARVEVDGTTADGTLEVRVRDNGVGFDPEFAEKLFGAFQRLHGMEDFEGHGIGLATVERIVRMHGGRARAEGAPGEGAVFVLTFPVDGGAA